MQGVPSSLIARNESWVRKQAGVLARRLPSNVEKADLIQVGLIAVAQSALSFCCEGDPDSAEGRDAFVRYARLRVKGAMLDELRQMDQLGRAERRKIKVIQIARERWRALHGSTPSLADLSQVCGLAIVEIARLEQAALMVQTESLQADADTDDHLLTRQASTPDDEVEARVDTAIVLRRLESFFATLPLRDQQVIDAYLGVGLTPTELAASWQVTSSRVSQLYKGACRRIAHHFGHSDSDAIDGVSSDARARFDASVSLREAALAGPDEAPAWSVLLEAALTRPDERFGTDGDGPRLDVNGTTRWG